MVRCPALKFIKHQLREPCFRVSRQKARFVCLLGRRKNSRAKKRGETKEGSAVKNRVCLGSGKGVSSRTVFASYLVRTVILKHGSQQHPRSIPRSLAAFLPREFFLRSSKQTNLAFCLLTLKQGSQKLRRRLFINSAFKQGS
jgi:hypothetical protein